MSLERVLRATSDAEGGSVWQLACGHQKAGALKVGQKTECASCTHLASIKARRERRASGGQAAGNNALPPRDDQA